MKYQKIWSKVLNDHEEVKYEFSIGQSYRTMCLVLWILLALFSLSSSGKFFVMFFFIGITVFFYLGAANAYAFTGKRVLIHKGWLSTIARSINYEQITEVTVVEPFLRRIFLHTGFLIIHTANVSDAIVFRNIANPYEIKKKLDLLRNK